jgi:hypothetical protein
METRAALGSPSIAMHSSIRFANCHSFPTSSYHPSSGSRMAFNNAPQTPHALRRSHGTIAKSNGIKVLSATCATLEIEPLRTTGRNLLRDLPIEYAKRVNAKAALVSTSWHNEMLALSESIIVKHSAELISRRRQLTRTSSLGVDDSRWLQEVECFIDEVIEVSGCSARSSPELLRAVRWMIAGATAQFGPSKTSSLLDGAAVADAA